MDSTDINLILAGLFLMLLFVFGVVYAAFHLLSTPKQVVQKRLDKLSSRFGKKSSAETNSQEHNIALDKEGSVLDQLAKDFLPRPIELKNRLAQAGLGFGIGKYSLISFIIALLLTLALNLFISTPLALSILIGIFLGLLLPHVWVSKRIKKRINTFTTLFPDAIDLIVRGLQSGLPVSDSIANVGREIPDPVGVEFTKMADNMRLGKPMEEAMWETAERLDTPDFKFFVISLSVQKETGGNLAETLSNLSKILRKRQSLKMKIRAMSSEGRASAFIVGALPFIMFGMLLSINYEYASILFTDSRAIIVAVLGLFWMGLGILVMAKMINFEL
ncbi:MAG: type II secretion system F family protein [Sphingomonadales bacterium]|nr:type II secretion system F family protein [Sphingomonadales bacterium]